MSGLAFVVLGTGTLSAAVIRWAGLNRAHAFYGGGALLVVGGLAFVRNREERLAVRLVLLLGAAAVVGAILSTWAA